MPRRWAVRSTTRRRRGSTPGLRLGTIKQTFRAGCTNSRAFREVARRTADTVRLRHDPCESRLSFEVTEPTDYASTLSSHSSRTLITDPHPSGAKIPRQCTIENCASLQRRTHFRPQTFHRYLTTYGPGQHPASARQTAKFNAKSYLLNTLLITTVLSST
jgi:hypothetical protein